MPQTLQMVIDSVAPKSEGWKRGARISKEDLKNNTGNIEWLTPGLEGEPINKIPIVIPPEREYRHGKLVETESSAKSPANSGGLIGFGKYRDKTLLWVKQNDNNYWNWATENIERLKVRAVEAGLV